MNVTQRFNHGLSFNFNYTYSKNLELTGSVDPFNRQLGKDLSGNDIPHVVPPYPAIPGAAPPRSGSPLVSNRIVSSILSDWGVGVYLNYQSALLINRPVSSGSVPISQFLGYGPGGAQLKKNADGSYMSPWSVDWTDYSGKHHTDPIDINCHCFDPTTTIVLNPDAWENIPDGQFGAQQSGLRFFRGIRHPTENLNISRTFRITERVQLNVRAEFNQIFNRMQIPQAARSVRSIRSFAAISQRTRVHQRRQHGPVQQRIRHHPSAVRHERHAYRSAHRPHHVLTRFRGYPSAPGASPGFFFGAASHRRTRSPNKPHAVI